MTKRHKKSIIAKIKGSKKQTKLRAISTVLAIAVIGGIVMLVSTKAATPSAKIEPESGTINSPAQKITDSSASGGSAVQFGANTTENQTFTLASIPDTQAEVQSTGAYPRFLNRIQWIIDNKDKVNIKYIWQVGDLQDWDDATHSHYERASAGLKKLEQAGVPYALTVGKFLIPGVANGNSPYLIAGVSIMIISLPGIYIAHGINRKTSVALISTYITLLVAIGFSITATSLLKLSGVANEDAWLLSQLKPEINMHGVLLCGLLISLVGILDDVTVGQASVIQELSIANSKLNTKELYKRGLRVGREHIASLINTLVLVYVGASLLFIMYLTVVVPYPTIMVLNSELMMEEIVRSLVGSASLILAVPITSVLAAKYLRKRR